jgi:serralysin
VLLNNQNHEEERTMIKRPSVFLFGMFTMLFIFGSGAANANSSDVKWVMTNMAYDRGYDGTIDEVNYYYYDYAGTLQQEEDDYDNDGIIDKIFHYYYNANGQLESKDQYIYYYYDDISGKLVNEEYDNNDDGAIDEEIFYYYNASGSIDWEELDGWRWDFDGIIDQVHYYIYDGNGRLIREEYDNGNDGTIDQEITYFPYDGAKNTTSEWYDYETDMVTEVDYMTYDDNGNSARYEQDLNNDGYIETVIYYTWQPLFNYGETNDSGGGGGCFINSSIR